MDQEEIEQLDLPPCVTEKTKAFLEKHELPGKDTSMADYCGPCHKQARRACFVLVVSEVVGVLLGWLTKAEDWEVWEILVPLQLFNVTVLYLEWECLKYVLLPWQHALWKNGTKNFSLPLNWLCRIGFDEWKIGISVVSLVVVLSLQNQAVTVGRDFQQHKTNFLHKCISGSCFLATLVGLVWVIVWSVPVCCGKVRWDFDRDRQKSDEEIHFKTIAYHLGLTHVETNHYEALIRYAHYAGMFGVQQMTNSLQEAEASLLWYAVEDFEAKCIARIQMVMKFNLALVFCRVLLRTVPQVFLSTWQYHNNWESWCNLVPLGVNLAVFLLSDCSTFLTAEGVYGEFTSRLLADEDDNAHFKERNQMMLSSRRYHHARFIFMALSAFVVSSCLCLVLADWICQPFQFSDGPWCRREQQTLAIVLVVCFMVFLIGLVGVSMWYFLEPQPLWEPVPRRNNMKLYVDEDATQYYWHIPSTTQVTMITDREQKFQHQGAHESHHALLKVDNKEEKQGKPFEDNKLLRVQEPGQQDDVERFSSQRKEFLLKQAKQDDWFELALRFSKELTPYQWAKEVQKHPKWKMIKLCGFDGGYPTVSGFVSEATNELLAADVVIWDGDWFCMQGWTGMIYTFLNAKKDSMAVAFQKRAEVPGFHRSYWKLYQQFPNRIQVVVMKDAGYFLPQPILKRHEWLEGEFEAGRLERPQCPEGDPGPYNKYLSVAMVGRIFQGDTKVIAMNGGRINMALAAIETAESPFKKIPWTVYEAWRVKQNKNEKTLFHYARDREREEKTTNPTKGTEPTLKLVQQEGTSAPGC